MIYAKDIDIKTARCGKQLRQSLKQRIAYYGTADVVVPLPDGGAAVHAVATPCCKTREEAMSLLIDDLTIKMSNATN